MTKIKKFFKRGNGELLGFAMVMPLFIWMLVMLITMAQISLAKEKLEYVTYSTGRAACTSDSYAHATSNARTIAEGSLEETNYDLDSISITPTTVTWAKGEYITITVTIDVDTMFWKDREYSSSIVMMIERSED